MVEFPELDCVNILLPQTYSTTAPVVDPGPVFHAAPAVNEYEASVSADIFTTPALVTKHHGTSTVFTTCSTSTSDRVRGTCFCQ